MLVGWRRVGGAEGGLTASCYLLCFRLSALLRHGTLCVVVFLRPARFDIFPARHKLTFSPGHFYCCLTSFTLGSLAHQTPAPRLVLAGGVCHFVPLSPSNWSKTQSNPCTNELTGARPGASARMSQLVGPFLRFSVFQMTNLTIFQLTPQKRAFIFTLAGLLGGKLPEFYLKTTANVQELSL